MLGRTLQREPPQHRLFTAVRPGTSRTGLEEPVLGSALRRKPAQHRLFTAVRPNACQALQRFDFYGQPYYTIATMQ